MYIPARFTPILFNAVGRNCREQLASSIALYESHKHACQRAYSMRVFKHIGLQPAWNMRAGLACFEFAYGAIDGAR
jgi:hypothetical protein